MCLLKGVWGWSGPWPGVPAAAGRSDGACREAWSCTSPHADVAQRAIQRGPCRLLLPMPTLLTTCPRGVGNVTYMSRWDETRAEEGRNRRLGRLPMRNGSRQGKAQLCDIANSCVSKICHTAPAYERPPLAETFCGIVSQPL